MKESCHVCMSHGTYELVMAHMNGSWYICMSHGAYDWVMSAVIHAGFVHSICIHVCVFMCVYSCVCIHVCVFMCVCRDLPHVIYEGVMSHMYESWRI